jgi:selenocysteine lyase/cysteine desulfurase
MAVGGFDEIFAKEKEHHQRLFDILQKYDNIKIISPNRYEQGYWRNFNRV